MKPSTHTGNALKVVNVMIIAMVVAGAAVFVILNQASSGRELMPTLFLAFLGAIITVQVIPGIVLLGSILKGVLSLGRKQVSTETHINNNVHK
jgi:hypothetical protein